MFIYFFWYNYFKDNCVSFCNSSKKKITVTNYFVIINEIYYDLIKFRSNKLELFCNFLFYNSLKCYISKFLFRNIKGISSRLVVAVFKTFCPFTQFATFIFMDVYVCLGPILQAKLELLPLIVRC